MQSDTAAQGGLLGQAQGWTNRVTGNLQGQAEHLKGKFAGRQGAPSQDSAMGQHAAGAGQGYAPSGTGAGYASGTGYGSTGTSGGYSEPATGYNTTGQQSGVAHGHNAHLSQGYAPAQASSGTGADGTYGHMPQKPSYTEQAKQWTARAADNLHGQAEYLKTKVVGTPGSTTAQVGQTSGTGYSQDTSPGQGRPTVAGHGQAVDYGISTGGTGIGQATGAPAKMSWTDSAKSWTASGLTYTQQGLEVVKNKVGGPTGSSGTGGTGSSYTAGTAASGTNADPNRRY